MFVFGDYVYTHSKRILQAFNYDEVVACLRVMHNHTKMKKDGYYVGYLTYECGILLQDSYYNLQNVEFHLNSNAHPTKQDTSMNADSNLQSKKQKDSKIQHDKEPLLYFELFLKRKKLKATNKYAKKQYLNNKDKLFKITRSLDKKQYELNFSHIKDNIQNGHTYQVNYTQEILLEPLLKKDPFTYFKILSNRQDTPYKAYIANKYLQILSLSPELFFHYKNHIIATQPMKGTAKRAFIEKNRQKNVSKSKIKPSLDLYKKYKKIPKIKGIDKVGDFNNLKTLHYDSKNRSENVMIVDLLRNDLSRIGLQGSVRVKDLFAIHTYPTLHQMVSTIQAKLPRHYGIIEILRALFPCGSITGAPKYKTTTIISELEQRKRGVYCGAIGVISKEESIMSVPIRTLYKYTQEPYYRYGVGSGVVWESLVEEEFSELQLKCKFLVDGYDIFSLKS